MNRSKMLGLSLLCLMPISWTQAALKPLSDDELSGVQGAGVGLVFENFLFSHTNDAGSGKIFRINGITTSEGDPVEIAVTKMYIARAGSDYGTNLLPVNLGRLNHPFKFELIDGASVGINNKAVIQISAPQQVPSGLASAAGVNDSNTSVSNTSPGNTTPVRPPDRPIPDRPPKPAPIGYGCIDGGLGKGGCVSRPSSSDFENGERPDIGFSTKLQAGYYLEPYIRWIFGVPTPAFRKVKNEPVPLNIHAVSAVIDGSYLRLWSDNNRLVAAFKLNFYTPELTISTCEDGGASCGKAIKFHKFVLELALGNSLQPMYLDVLGSGSSGDMVLQVKSIAQAAAERFNTNVTSLPAQLGWSGGGTRSAASNKAMWDYFNSYYTNPDYRSNLSFGQLEIVSNGSSTMFGSSSIDGLLIQYLKITTHDLAP